MSDACYSYSKRQVVKCLQGRWHSVPPPGYVVPIKHLEITFSDKPVLTFPIISSRASSSCPKPIIYINRNWDSPKDSKGIDVVITS